MGSAQAESGSERGAYCNGGWNYQSFSWGATAGSHCWNPAQVTGWIKDHNKYDGRCAQIRFDWYQNGTWVGAKHARACGNEPRKDFNLKSPYPHADWVNWQFQLI